MIKSIFPYLKFYLYGFLGIYVISIIFSDLLVSWYDYFFQPVVIFFYMLFYDIFTRSNLPKKREIASYSLIIYGIISLIVIFYLAIIQMISLDFGFYFMIFVHCLAIFFCIDEIRFWKL